MKGSQDECTNSLKIIQRTTKPPSSATRTKKTPAKLYIDEEEEEDEQEEDEREDENEREVEEERDEVEEDESETTGGNRHHRSVNESTMDKENNYRTFDDTHAIEEHDEEESVCRVEPLMNVTSNRPSTTVSSNVRHRLHNTRQICSLTFSSADVI